MARPSVHAEGGVPYDVLGDKVVTAMSELHVGADRRQFVPPFAVVSSNQYRVDELGTKTPVRTYDWGQCEVNNPHHSDLRLIE